MLSKEQKFLLPATATLLVHMLSIGAEHMKGSCKGRGFVLAVGVILSATSLSFSQSKPADPIAAAAKLSQPDVYYWTGNAWQPMEPVTWSSSGVKKTNRSSV